ncbi:TMV resistance protein N [Artemisia annua]|uniref:TMV resistance protein N n=1 Tax=Artemisia annua TaxID=35608 RepID=A0A2U1NUI6_ARTAN|nr:TMV resistance protein N [Artemisia annua]
MNPSSSSSASSSSSLITRKRGSTCSDDETEQPNCKRLKSLKNDVFINYSFEEIGNSFISHLKRSLIRHGFFTSDHKDLQVGQDVCSELLKTIEESEIYVVVFSNNYASSVRSLDELVNIMDCLGKFEQRKILPVFYKVEPSDVRSQEGSFKEAFQAHEANGDIDPKRVQKWKQALKDAGQLSGLTLQNGDEGKFVSDIVEQLEKMQSPKELHVADHPVVVGSRVKDLISTLRLDCEDVLVVAVFGISGIGKTTIVKATYNKICSYFDISCFLGDIHHHCGGPNSKIELQNLLISCLTQNYKLPIMHYHNDRVTEIKALIRGRKILLVLDDVDNFEQLKSLGINPASFFKGSRIIVITREKRSLGSIPYTSYQTTELKRRESLSLFNRLMFSRDNNLVNMKFLEEVAALAGGLPLVLEVWSRYFIGHERKQWPSLLKKLKRIPHGDVQNQLQMSYDSLSDDAKNLFLDIACFFVGMNKELVVKVLHDEESTFFPDIEIQHLVDKFLVKDTDQYNRSVTMNHAIKEMGHEVGTDSVRSIQLDLSQMEEGETLQLEAFKKMSSLRFINIYKSDVYKMITLRWSSTNDDMSACFSFKHLKYLEWVGFPCKSLDNIDMGNVVVIKLWNSKLEKLWEGVKNFKKLKILEVSGSESLTKTGNFIGLENLEKLVLQGCYNLEELDSSISCLHQLTSLTLSNCTNLKSIPDLPLKIEYFEANDCENLVNLPSNCSELQFQWKLQLGNCSKLGSEGFTQVVTTLRNLQELGMGNCNISQVSNGIGNLVSLRHLGLSGNTFSSLPESFSNLSKLEELYIIGCSELQLLPPLPSQLRDIYADNCGSLDLMPFDSMQNAYIFRSKESRLLSNERLLIDLSGKEVPEWCTYRDSGNVLSFVAPIQFDHSKIWGLILCATRDKYAPSISPEIYNKTKGTSHQIRDFGGVWGSMFVMFYPLNNTTLVVEAGDTLEVEFNDKSLTSGGLRLVYENDVVDSGLVLKDVSITELNDEDVCSFPIQDEEYTYSDFSPMVS